MALTPEQIAQNRFDRMLHLFRTKLLGKCVSMTARSFQLMIRMEAADDDGIVKCVACGQRGHYKTFDAGHFIHHRQPTRFIEMNCHPECKQCNQFDTHGKANANYHKFMLETYGESAVEELRLLSQTDLTYSREELVQFRIDFMDRIKRQEKRLGI